MVDATQLETGITDDREPSAPRRRGRARLWIIIAAVAFLVMPALAASLVYTEKSSFCRSCHEMDSYYAAWARGPHAGHAECVDCHVDAGTLAHLKHKPAALKEVWDHFFSRTTYPTYAVEVPDSRCTGCHRTVPDKIASAGPLFSHDAHATKGSCKGCHLDAGHDVTFEELREAGVLRAGATTPTVAGMKPSAIPGHITVVCQRCHDQAETPCSKCHTAPHEFRGECSECHHTGAKWEPGHTSRTDCTSCHTPPKPHFGKECATCHAPAVPFAKTVYTHGPSTACASCHAAPSGHYGSSCSGCHTPRVPFAKTVYRHVAGSRCSGCHHAPSSHYGSSCSTCHSPSVPFASTVYRHVAGSNCRNCHRPPSNHFSSTCSTCHKPTVAFAKTTFTHTSNSSCAQCHHAPANHFGTVCASCHKPSVPFASATFSHPRTQHSYRSFACVKCHPSSYTVAYCSCHNGHPPTD